MRILVVEDDQDKLRQVLKALSAGGAKDEAIDIARDARQAKLQAKQSQYDLMVLDLVIPTHPAESPTQDGGVGLLLELKERDRFHMPREVVGLTAFADMRDEAADLFAQDMWSIIIYDPTTEQWSDQLSRKVSHLLVAERAVTVLGFESHLCVVTALQIELDALLRLPWQWHEFQRPSDITLYFQGEVICGGKTRKVYAASAPRMGMTATAVLATKMIEAYRPELIAMTGIAAGVKGRCDLGDVIVADPSWDWGSGKHSTAEGVARFAAAPHQIPISAVMRMRIERLARQPQICEEIRQSWPGEPPSTSLKVLIGPVASGASVLADQDKVSTIEQQHRKLLAIEMETYGLFAAAAEARVPQPIAFSLKGVSDFANEGKGDSLQRYAAYASAGILRNLIERF
jgi:nucleoside phosphorylase/CheY-like chemotaxis protein